LEAEVQRPRYHRQAPAQLGEVETASPRRVIAAGFSFVKMLRLLHVG